MCDIALNLCEYAHSFRAYSISNLLINSVLSAWHGF